MIQSLEFWRTATLTAAALGQTAFALFYLTLPWWRTFLGRALFFKAATFMLLLDIGVAGRIFDWPGEEATIVALYGLVSFGTWGQFAAFVHQGRRKEPKL